jgi:hypothetical protein
MQSRVFSGASQGVRACQNEISRLNSMDLQNLRAVGGFIETEKLVYFIRSTWYSERFRDQDCMLSTSRGRGHFELYQRTWERPTSSAKTLLDEYFEKRIICGKGSVW